MIKGELENFEAVSETPYRFDGEISVVVGAYSYSSAILFANTMQDFGFANIVGEQTGGYSWQTGGTQLFTFPHSKLIAVSPRFYLQRPSGKMKGEPVNPDIKIATDPFLPDALIKQLVKQFEANYVL